MSIKYTESHEWVREDGGEFTVGITDYAQQQLGEIVYVDLPEVDKAVAAGEEAAVVESVKAAGDVKSPVAGSVSAVNEALNDKPELVNEDPEGDGWFYKLKADGMPDGLMDESAYKKFVDGLG